MDGFRGNGSMAVEISCIEESKCWARINGAYAPAFAGHFGSGVPWLRGGTSISPLATR